MHPAPTPATADEHEIVTRVRAAIDAIDLPRWKLEESLATGGLDALRAHVWDAVVDTVMAELTAATSTETATLTAHGLTCRISADPDAASPRDPAGTVTSCEVAGHPGVQVHTHASTSVPDAVTVLVDAPEGTTILLDVNDCRAARTLVGDNTVHVGQGLTAAAATDHDR
ncbi:hypothetical protein [Dietzia sp. 179-F 9C3 NHS]|uniref:hypothetical protein n=1 Tax=Dietzia sp. 179-F 9C3 NHS TaxID=3374295 RepID=UPI0038791BF2